MGMIMGFMRRIGWVGLGRGEGWGGGIVASRMGMGMMGGERRWGGRRWGRRRRFRMGCGMLGGLWMGGMGWDLREGGK